MGEYPAAPEAQGLIVGMYVAYLAISVALTVWVARTLSRHGRVFLVDVFGGDGKIAEAVNSLLVVGFYLINLGYVSLALRVGDRIVQPSDAIEALSVKIGGVLLVLGAMHFLNLFVFSRIRRSRTVERMTAPPAGPAYWTPPAPPTPAQA